MVEANIVDGVLVLWTPDYLWPPARAADPLAKRRRMALERLASVVADEAGIDADLATRRDAEILGALAHA